MSNFDPEKATQVTERLRKAAPAVLKLVAKAIEKGPKGVVVEAILMVAKRLE